MASRLYRLLRMIRLVRKPRYPGVADLCRILDVRPRTIFNDLKELKDVLGVNIKYSKSRGGYYLEDDDWQLTFWGMDQSVAVVLLAAFRLLAASGGEGLVNPLRQLFGQEIHRCLREDWNIDGELDELFRLETREGPGIDHNLFVELCKACARSQPVLLTVHAEHASGNHGLAATPLFLTYSAEGWHCMFHADGGDHQIAVQLESIAALAPLPLKE